MHGLISEKFKGQVKITGKVICLQDPFRVEFDYVYKTKQNKKPTQCDLLLPAHALSDWADTRYKVYRGCRIFSARLRVKGNGFNETDI